MSKREEKIFGASHLPFDAPAKVKWKDGVSGNRKIIYIPQSWLNRVVDEFHGDSQLNLMLEDILLQQVNVKNAETKLKNRIAEIIDEVKHNILDYVTAKIKVEKFEMQLKEGGRSNAFVASINALEKQREKMSSEAGLTDDILQEYAKLKRCLLNKTEELEKIKNEKAIIDSQVNPFVYLPGFTKLQNDVDYMYHLDELHTTQKLMDDAINRMNSEVLRIWNLVISKIQSTIEKKKLGLGKEIEHINVEVKPLKEKISQSDALNKIDVQLQEEQLKYKLSKDIETKQTANFTIMKELKGKVLASRSAIEHEYEDYEKIISGTIIPNSNLLFDAEIKNKQQDLFEAINSLFHNKSIRPFREKYGYDFSSQDNLKIDDGLFTALWNAMEDGTLNFKGGNTIQSALERLFSDWLYVHFSVKSGNDEINKMSPGKKAIVLLEIIVNLEGSKCPILIDQPEDDLDNRSIYVDLVQYLKKKKSERQIIVVTHNANIVVGADAEEVIIANQNGDESKNNSKRFEYRCGAIETITPVLDENNNVMDGVLYQKGIQQQICDILEGGIEAFELRKNKYRAYK